MPEYLSPGVYIEEVQTGPRPIEAVGTACAAFVGFAPAGPLNEPILITNWSQYVRVYGREEEGGKVNPHLAGSYLSHSVYGYFLNGGGRCYVVRVGGDGADGKESALQIPSQSSPAVPSLTVQPQASLAPGDIQVEVAPATGEAPPEGAFTIKIRQGETEEVIENVTLGRRSSKPIADTVAKTSKLVLIQEAPGNSPLAERGPSPGVYTLKASQLSALPRVQPPAFIGDVSTRSGLEGLEITDDVTMVCAPDVLAAYNAKRLDRDGVKAIQLAMINHCERMGDRMAILDPLPDLNPQDVQKWRQNETNFDSKFAVLYYPWIKVAGPDGLPMPIPPSGHMAGVWARNDNERGVHKAPANEVIRGALEVMTPVTKGEQDVLNPIGVNCIRPFVGRGIRVWGARTLSSDPAWRYINVRRLFNFVEKSIEQGTQWVVFEPNDSDLWARVRRDVGAFLTIVWRDGALFGATADEAFFVKCDAELNPPEVRDLGMLYIDIGMAPVKPAEFVIFRFSQYAGGGA